MKKTSTSTTLFQRDEKSYMAQRRRQLRQLLQGKGREEKERERPCDAYVHEENVNFYDSLSKRGEELYGSKKTSTSTTPLNLSSNESYDAMAGERI